MPTLTPKIQAELYAETDARFWAQTGLRPGKKLDPRNWIDQAFVPVWEHAYAQVLAEWKHGKLVKTYDHPAVVSLIGKAADLFHRAATFVDNALAQPTLDAKNAYAAQAKDAHDQANAATTLAATYQPPTVSPELAAQAAQQVYSQVSAPPATVAVITEPSAAAPATVLPSAPPQMTVREAIDALQASHAPGKAAATEEQTPAPDAPKHRSPLLTVGVALGCIGAVLLAGSIGQRQTVSEASRTLAQRRHGAHRRIA